MTASLTAEWRLLRDPWFAESLRTHPLVDDALRALHAWCEFDRRRSFEVVNVARNDDHLDVLLRTVAADATWDEALRSEAAKRAVVREPLQ